MKKWFNEWLRKKRIKWFVDEIKENSILFFVPRYFVEEFLEKHTDILEECERRGVHSYALERAIAREYIKQEQELMETIDQIFEILSKENK